ncbi:MAG TPA: DUF3667 domain-containing protein [Steroidobacteraceae bacterium]|nr:DUF3667 domain-containing protein [Steroidobacteraceae bacterium]
MKDASGGTTHCANCGAALADRYCSRCGQDSHGSLSFGHFLHEFVEGVFHVDSSFWRTLRQLVTRPGLLTEQYLGGKRRSYTPPFRTYLVISLVYFVLASVFEAPSSRVVSTGGREMQATDCAQLAANPGWVLRFVPDLENRCVRALSDDRRALTTAMENLLPKVMFAVLPLVALVQFWVFRRQRPLYLENLVFVLHFQSFFYLTGALALLLGAGIAALAGPRAMIGELFDFAIYVWSVVYLFIASRRVYRAGILKTVLGLVALAAAYMVFYVLGISVASMYAFMRV